MSFAAVALLDHAVAFALGAETPGGRIDEDPGTAVMLGAALALTGVGVCLCDAEDRVRYLNEAFRATMFPGMDCEGEVFTDLLRAAILSERSMRLDSMPLDGFLAQVRERRRKLEIERAFPVDLKDGRWLYLNERKLPNGWILVATMDISSMKLEEFRLRAAHSSAMHDASTDALTAVPNRRHGLELAEAAVATARSSLRPLSVAILDIDHFKRINDTLGHQAGDRVLVDFAATLLRRAPRPMIVARIGGEEFLIAMPDTTVGQAKGLLEQVARDLASVGVFEEATGVRYTFSAGVSELRRDEDLDKLLSRSDGALYRAKRDGRSRIVIDRESDGSSTVRARPPSRRCLRETWLEA